jgi:hypothetical protein
MNPRITAKIIAAIILGVVISLGEHHMAIQRGEMGKQAFEASQDQRFDKLYSKPHTPFFRMGILLTGGFLGIYELLSFGIFAIIKPKKSPSSA